MNVNILRSPKKDKHKQKVSKKVTSSKKASPYKKSRIPKESTPPRKSPKKTTVLPLASSPNSSTSTKVAKEDSSNQTLDEIILQTSSTKIASEASKNLTFKLSEVATTNVRLAEKVAEPVSSSFRNDLTEKAAKQMSRKRKSQEDLEEGARKKQSPEQAKVVIETIEIEDTILDVQEADADIEAIVEEKVELSEQIAEVLMRKEEENIRVADIARAEEEKDEEEEKEEEQVREDKADDVEKVCVAALLEKEKKEEKEDDEEEVSMIVEEKVDVEVETSKSLDKKKSAENKSRQTFEQAFKSDPIKGKTDIKAALTQLRSSLDDSNLGNETKIARNDDVFSSDGEGEVVPSSSSTSSAPKQSSLLERIDKFRPLNTFRAIFSSPASRPASSIPKLSPPKFMQSPPRPQLSSIAKPASKPSLASSLETRTLSKQPAAKPIEKSAAKVTPKLVEKEKSIIKAVEKTIEKPIEKAAEKALEKPIEKIVEKAAAEKPKSKPAAAAAAIPITSPASSSKVVRAVKITQESAPTVSIPALAVKRVTPPTKIVPQALAPAAIAPIKVAAPAVSSSSSLVQASSVKIAIKVPSQIKPVAAPAPTIKMTAPSQSAAPSISIANPFQNAQQQQQQTALATTLQLRAKTIVPPPPSTAHIELEEPDSAYSDSEDEETVRRRMQHKPWETREGLAKALEEQATIDADMIFGIPHGAVPIDEILPAETEYARAKRARPRSSSATWSRDGLKQVEIDLYNERMGIQGPGVLLPITVQDDGSGTPSRTHRLSAIAQSAIIQGQISRKPSQSAARASVSPIRPGSSLSVHGSAKYQQLSAGTPLRTKSSASTIVTASAQKVKVVKQGGVAVSKSVAKSNPFQNGGGGSSTLQTSKIVNNGVKPASMKK